MINQPLEPLICPQCGGQVDEANSAGGLARCEYCSTQFRISRPVQAAHWSVPTVAAYGGSPDSRKGSSKGNALIVILVTTAFAGFIFYMVNGIQKKTNEKIDQAQDVANSAKAAANAMRQAANAMANAQRAVNTATNPKPTPGPSSH